MSAWLIDTNLLMRSADVDSAQHSIAADCLCELAARKKMVFASNQTYFECWVVATRPIGSGGLGWDESRASNLLNKARKQFLNLRDPENIVQEWLRILQTYHITGYKSHDMRLVAYARLHRIPRILTFNTDDFKAVSSEITVVHPADYLANSNLF